MEKGGILFDDWETRYDSAFQHRKKAYFFSLICASFLLFISIVGVFIEWPIIVMLVISLATLTSITLEWLKVKNNHLVIRNNAIEVTNRFNKTVIYDINIGEIFLKLRPSFNRRSGGIVMKFYDSKGNLICKYEDMLNGASPFGVERTNWEIRIAALGIRIDDPEGIIKNG